MLKNKHGSIVHWMLVLATPMFLIGCETSSRLADRTGAGSLETVAAGAHAAFVTDPTIDITLTASGDEILLVVDSVDTINGVATYVGTADMGDPGDPVDVEITMGPTATNFTISCTPSGNVTYVLAVNTDTNQAYTMEIEQDGDDITAVVRTLAGTELASVEAAGAWELAYPPTQALNMPGLLSIVVLGAQNGCDPTFDAALTACISMCGTGQVRQFSYSCISGAVSVTCVCKESD